jgi:hypothetical protein
MRKPSNTIALATLLSAACAEPTHFGYERRPYTAPQSHPESQLFLQLPELDQRIQQHSPSDGTHLGTYYPDLWDAQTRGIRDLALSKRHVFALLSRYGHYDDDRLLVAERSSGQTRSIALGPNPQRLSWSANGELLVAHFGSRRGGPGRLSVIDTQHLRPLTVVALNGACISATGSRSRAFVVERVNRRGDEQRLVSAFYLAEIDIDQGKVIRRLPLPAGARQVTIGPTGLLYVSHASGSGLHATDGTISVFDPVRWLLVDRIDLEMVIRRMRASRELLLLNLLSSSGEAWFGAIQSDHQTRYDFRLPELVTSELALIDNTAYLASRSAARLIGVELVERPVLRRIDVPAIRAKVDRIGLLRAVRAEQD